MTLHELLIVIEHAGANFSAYSPDLPGGIATGATREETERNMVEAIRLHIAGLREDNLPTPDSSYFAEVAMVQARWAVVCPSAPRFQPPGAPGGARRVPRRQTR